jgi:hypothetical protein
LPEPLYAVCDATESPSFALYRLLALRGDGEPGASHTRDVAGRGVLSGLGGERVLCGVTTGIGVATAGGEAVGREIPETGKMRI